MKLRRRRAPRDALAAARGVAARVDRRYKAGLLALAVLAVIVGGLAQLRLDTTVRSFVPDSDPAYADIEAKARSFGDDPILVVAQTKQPQDIGRNGTLLLQFLSLEGKLSKLPNVSSVYGPGTVLNQIAISAQDFLAEISGRRDALQEQARLAAKRKGASPTEIEAAANRAVAGFDARYGALLVQAMPAGLPTLSNPSFVASVLYDRNQHARSQWRFIVPNDRNVVVIVRPRAGLDQAAANSLVHDVQNVVGAAGLQVDHTTVTGVPVITSALGAVAQSEFPLISTIAVVAVALIFFVAPWSRRRRDRLAPLAVSVAGSLTTVALFGWTQQSLSLGVVAFLPILMGIGSDFPYYLMTHRLTRPVVVASAAAAAGCSALAFSALPFVRELGVALAVGLVLTMTYAVAAARLGFTAGATRRATGPATVRVRRFSGRLVALLLICVVTSGAGWVMFPGLHIEARPEQIAKGLPELSAAERVEAEIGSSGEIDVLLTGPNALSPAALRWAREAETAILQRNPGLVRAVVTPGDMFAFLGKSPTVAEVEAGLSLMPTYLTKTVVKADQSASLLTFGVSITDIAGEDALVSGVRAALPPVPPGLVANVVGLPVLTSRAVALASQDRIILNLAGLALAAVVVGIGLGLRSAIKVIATGLLATGSLLLLVAVLVGHLNPLTVAIGALVTATATEFSVLLDVVPGDQWRRIRVVGTAALAGIAGFLALTLSRLATLREFGLLLAAGLLCSFAAALVVAALPSMRPRTHERSAPRTQRAHPKKDVLV